MYTQCSILFYLYCEWEHFPPTYRIYFDDELMNEREYIWKNDKQVLQENIPVITDITVPHTVRIEPVGQQSGTFRIEKILVTPAKAVISVEIA